MGKFNVGDHVIIRNVNAICLGTTAFRNGDEGEVIAVRDTGAIRVTSFRNDHGSLLITLNELSAIELVPSRSSDSAKIAELERQVHVQRELLLETVTTMKDMAQAYDKRIRRLERYL